MLAELDNSKYHPFRRSEVDAFDMVGSRTLVIIRTKRTAETWPCSVHGLL